MFRFKYIAITAFYDYLVGTHIFTVYSCLHISFAGINVCNFVMGTYYFNIKRTSHRHVMSPSYTHTT